MFSQTRAIALKFGTKVADSYRHVGIVTAGFLAPVLSFAADGADPFDAAVADIQGKITGYGGKLVLLAAAGVAFVVAIKYVKKIPRAA